MTTPQTPLRPPSRTRRQQALGSISVQKFNHVAGLVASARKEARASSNGVRSSDDDGVRLVLEEEEDEEDVEEEARDRVGGLKTDFAERERQRQREREREPEGDRAGPSRLAETSFQAEPSFIQAPLNSRLPPLSSQPPPAEGKTRRSKGKERASESDGEVNLRGISLELQEAMVLEDLLLVLLGIEGTLITYSPSSPHVEEPIAGVEFICNPTLDPSIRDLVYRILPIATNYTALEAFVELKSSKENGLVNHALCGALRTILQEHVMLVARLENAFLSPPSVTGEGGLTLHSLLPYLAPTQQTLALLCQLASSLMWAPDAVDDESPVDPEEERRNRELGLEDAEKAMKGIPSQDVDVAGGEVVEIVWDSMRRMSGDPLTPTILTPLLARLSTPYARILLRWAESGVLSDPHAEFFVEARLSDRLPGKKDLTDEYWDKRYTLRDGTPVEQGKKEKATAGVPLPRKGTGRLPGGACVPGFLDRWKRKVLLAGKYVNVIRECGRDVGRPREEWEGGMDCEPFYKRIEDAYTHANRTLLKLLVEEEQLIPRLRSLKRYFFLSNSAFFTHFLDLSIGELRRSARNVSLTKLQALLELAMNQPDEGTGGYKEDIKLTKLSRGLFEFLLEVAAVNGAVTPGMQLLPQEEKGKDDKKKELLTMEALALEYNVPFPVSLVISSRSLVFYQSLFRLLLYLKVTEHSLLSMYLDQTQLLWRARAPPSSNASTPVPASTATLPSTGGSSRPSSRLDQPSRPASRPALSPAPVPEVSDYEAWRRRVFNLRSRMISLLQHIQAYVTSEVLEPNWRDLEAKLEKVSTVDQLLSDHFAFLEDCMKRCGLTSAKLLQYYGRLLLTCSTFAHYSGHLNKWATKGERDSAARWEFLIKFERNYSHNFSVFFNCLQYLSSSDNTALLSLVVRLRSNDGAPR